MNNPSPTTGGSRQEFTRISQKDVDAAMAKLVADLNARFATEVQHPNDVPEGTTPFPDTAVLGDPTPSVDPKTLVGQEVDTFTLGLSADGTVLAADASPAEAIGEQRLQASVAEGRELVPGSTSVEIGDGTVVDGRIEFPVTASASQVRPLDAAALERTVLGMPDRPGEGGPGALRRGRHRPVAELGHLGPVTRAAGDPDRRPARRRGRLTGASRPDGRDRGARGRARAPRGGSGGEPVPSAG